MSAIQIVSPDGGRPLSGDDLLLINQTINTLEEQFKHGLRQQGAYIVHGCRFTPKNQAETVFDISEGLVYILTFTRSELVRVLPQTDVSGEFFSINTQDTVMSVRAFSDGSSKATRTERQSGTFTVQTIPSGDLLPTSSIIRTLHRYAPNVYQALAGVEIHRITGVVTGSSYPIKVVIKEGWALRRVTLEHNNVSSSIDNIDLEVVSTSGTVRQTLSVPATRTAVNVAEVTSLYISTESSTLRVPDFVDLDAGDTFEMTVTLERIKIVEDANFS